jgi:hypothetical protein
MFSHLFSEAVNVAQIDGAIDRGAEDTTRSRRRTSTNGVTDLHIRIPPAACW